MTPYYAAEAVTLYLGDCIEVMRQMPPASVDAVVCDPPYGLEFMGKDWDAPWKSDGFRRAANEADVGRDDPFGRTSRTGPQYRAGSDFQQWCEQWAREAYRVLKPGGHLAAFGGTRTYHRMASGVEDAGFEIRDTLAWMYGSGFPKSLDVSKAIDRAAGAAREVIGRYQPPNGTEWNLANDETRSEVGAGGHTSRADSLAITAPATEAARQWAGWGTALKPAYEPIVLARKPLGGTVAANVIAHGTGALNIDASRIGVGEYVPGGGRSVRGGDGVYGDGSAPKNAGPHTGGRWPANVLLDEAAAALLDAQTGDLGGAGRGSTRGRDDDGSSITLGDRPTLGVEIGFGDRGGASRFFYTAKASRSEREAGLDELPLELRTDGREPGGHGGEGPRLRVTKRRNDHPTVKPVSLMRWLCRLVTLPGGTILDPFLGSGTTAMGALDTVGLQSLDERFHFIGIDIDAHYLEVARYRTSHRHLLETDPKAPTVDMEQGRLL